MGQGLFDEYEQPKIEVVIIGTKTSLAVEALIDTGFDGDICLPIEAAIQLGLELCGSQPIELADGTRKNELVFSGMVEVDADRREVEVILTQAKETLFGTGLLKGKVLKVDFEKKSVEIMESK